MSFPASDGQRAAADPSLSAWVTANAGSGKTKVLVDRVARLLLTGAAPDRILASTFTKAAAAEMQGRLFARLGAWAVADDAGLARDLNALEGRVPDAAVGPDVLSRARGLFARALETPGGLKVKTIHALCQDILQRFPLEAGLHPGFAVREEAEAATALERAIRAARSVEPEAATVFALAGEDGLRDRLMAQFLALAPQIGAPEAAVGRLHALLDVTPGATPGEITAQAVAALDLERVAGARDVLRGERSATDLKVAEALDAALQEADPEAFFEALYKAVLTDAGAPRKLALSAAARAHRIVAVELGPDKETPGALVAWALALIDRRKAAQTALLSAAAVRLGAGVLQAYEAEKRATGVLDFDDLIARATGLLAGPDGAAQWVLFKLDQGLDHILVDEAQDTSPRQWALLKPLIAEMQAGEGARGQDRTLFVVGDEKQSIFSFQGADPEAFLAEKAAFAAGDPERRVTPLLATSYRSTPQVLALVDAVWAAGGRAAAPHIAHRADAGFIEWRPFTPKAQAGPGEDPMAPVNALAGSAPKVRLAREIAGDIARWLAEGRAVADKGGLRPIRPEDVLILVRSRDALASQLLRELQRCAVPVAGADRIRLADDLAVRDILACLKVALLPEDDLTLATVLKGPFVGRLDDEAHLRPLLGGRPRGVTAWDRLRASTDADWAPARTFVEELLARVSQLPPFDVIAALLDRRGGDGRTGWQALIARLGPEAREPVEVLMSRALAYGATGPASLESFVHEIETAAIEVKREFGSEAATGVRIMTVHGAKGLEAPVVILPQTTGHVRAARESLFLDAEAGAVLVSLSKRSDPGPAARLRAQADAAAAREDARLLYVALTRARDQLIVCGAQYHNSRAEGCWHAQVEAALRALPGVAEGPDQRLILGVAPPLLGAVAQPADVRAPPPAWATAPAPADAMPPRAAAPSRIAALEPPPAPSPRDSQAPDRFRRGSLIHALLERLPDAPPDQRAGLAARRLAAEPDLDAAMREDIVREVLAVLDHPEFAAVFGPGSRAEAAIAGAGPGLPDGVVVNGAIDRLVITDAEILILDYKTNRPPPARAQDVDGAYIAQLAAYRAVLAGLYPDRPVRCALLWTHAPRLMEIPGALLDAALRGAGHGHT